MIFLKGRLYFRVVEGLLESLFYTTKDVPEGYNSFQSEHIAKSPYGETVEPLFSTYTDLAHDGEFTSSGRLIEFRKAGEENLRALLKEWNPRYNLADWLKRVDREAHILIGEKQRLRYIVSQFL